MRLTRRGALAATVSGTVIAGCTDQPDGDTGPDAPGAYSVEAIPAADPLPVELSATVRDGTLTDPEAPLTVAVTVSNETDQSVVFGERRNAQFMQESSRDPEGEYVLLPEAWLDTEEEIHGFEAGGWVRYRGVEITADYQTTTLEAGAETTTELYLLIDARQTDPEQAVPETFPEEIVFETDVGTATDTDRAGGPPETTSTWGLRFQG